MIHELKTDSEMYQAIIENRKTFELRKNDRDFKVDDILYLRETVYTSKEMKENNKPLLYTNRGLKVRILYILYGPIYGLNEGWCIMSFGRIRFEKRIKE